MSTEQIERWYCLSCQKRGKCDECKIKKVKESLRKCGKPYPRLGW